MSTRKRWILLVVLLAFSATGCHRKQFVRNQSISMNPPLVSTNPMMSDPMMGAPRGVTFVDRHPMLRKPVEYYESSGPSSVRKVAAATFIGVPAGLLGEMRQIVVGCPPGF